MAFDLRRALNAWLDVLLKGLAWPASLVLMEFPDFDSASEWYHSPEYQKILHLRTDNTISDLILADEVEPGFTSAMWAERIARRWPTRAADARRATPGEQLHVPTGGAANGVACTALEADALTFG